MRKLKLPRAVYWVLGAIIAFSGAVIARIVAEKIFPDYRVAIWFVGAGVIFIGLCVLSLGTKSRLGDAGQRKERRRE